MGAVGDVPGAEAVAGGDSMLDELLLHVRDPLVVTDRAGRILCATRSAELLLDAPRRRLVGALLVALVPVEARPAVRRALNGDRELEVLELALVRRGGETYAARLELQRAGDRLFWRVDDAPDLDEELEPALVRLVDGLSEGFVAVDPALRVSVANRPARRALGISVGATLPERWGGFDLGTFARALFRREAMHGEALVRPTDGEAYTLTGLPSSGRRLSLLLLSDTSRKERLDRLEREFIANAAHELQTPLTAILGAAELLHGGSLDEPERDRFLEHLHREARRLVRLVESLLLLARAGSGPLHREPVLVRHLLDDVSSRLRPRPGVRVDVLAPPNLLAHTNLGLVDRVLMNVAENAVKHTRAGQILLSARRSRRGVVIEVRDTGSGMPAATLDQAPERFYRGGDRSADGFGLGLSIAHQAAQALGGVLELESTVGAGTVARLVLGPEAV